MVSKILTLSFLAALLSACSPSITAQPAGTPTPDVEVVKTQAVVPVYTATPTVSVPTFTPSPVTLVYNPQPLPDDIFDTQGVPMRLVPAGLFTMGSDAGMPDEKPVHTVDLPAFYMDKYEVTNARYKVCVDAGACQTPANSGLGYHGDEIGTYGHQEFDNYPVTWVDWSRAQTYCEWRGARLPGETEWEKAARGTDGRKYPWGASIDPTFANYGNHAPDNFVGLIGKATAAGRYPKGQSPYGIHDMAGNVWEWVADWYDVYPGGDISANSAFGQQTYRVLRGGSWNNEPEQLRTTFRGGNSPDTTLNYIGFRCARTP
jgi:formylglycine-generating enzyme required for sulfatase activity